jgi:hypothetical protein
VRGVGEKGIEVYHRTLKPCGGVDRAQGRKAVSILGHWLLALRAFLRLEAYRLRTGRTILPGRHLAHRCPSPRCPTCATPLLRQKVGAAPAPFVEGASRETVHEGGQRMHGGLAVFVYSFPIR